MTLDCSYVLKCIKTDLKDKISHEVNESHGVINVWPRVCNAFWTFHYFSVVFQNPERVHSAVTNKLPTLLACKTNSFTKSIKINRLL